VRFTYEANTNANNYKNAAETTTRGTNYKLHAYRAKNVFTEKRKYFCFWLAMKHY